MYKVDIFVASSNELKSERNIIAKLCVLLNNHLHSKGILLNLRRWEYLNAAAPEEGRNQDIYNQILRKSQGVLILLYTKLGQFTEEEYRETVDNNIPTKILLKKDNRSVEELENDLRDLRLFYEHLDDTLYVDMRGMLNEKIAVLESLLDFKTNKENNLKLFLSKDDVSGTWNEFSADIELEQEFYAFINEILKNNNDTRDIIEKYPLFDDENDKLKLRGDNVSPSGGLQNSPAKKNETRLNILLAHDPLDSAVCSEFCDVILMLNSQFDSYLNVNFYDGSDDHILTNNELAFVFYKNDLHLLDKEKLESIYDHFRTHHHPREIYVYIRNNSFTYSERLRQCMEMMYNRYGHFYSAFFSIAEMKYNVLTQLLWHINISSVVPKELFCFENNCIVFGERKNRVFEFSFSEIMSFQDARLRKIFQKHYGELSATNGEERNKKLNWLIDDTMLPQYLSNEVTKHIVELFENGHPVEARRLGKYFSENSDTNDELCIAKGRLEFLKSDFYYTRQDLSISQENREDHIKTLTKEANEIVKNIWEKEENLDLNTVRLMCEFADWHRVSAYRTDAFNLFAATYESCKNKLETEQKIEILYAIQTCTLNVGPSPLTENRRKYKEELENFERLIDEKTKKHVD